uniref:Phosphotransferase n=1 Tax=Gopherus agassizii TaxID=38772 RepID=A0A452HC13_9SAUR
QGTRPPSGLVHPVRRLLLPEHGGCLARRTGNSLRPLCLSLETLHRVKSRMLEAMERGLSRRTHSQATVRMLPAFIRSTPDGTERGEFLVLELGDTHLRVLLMELSGDTDQRVTMKERCFPVPDAIAQGPGEKVWGQGTLAPAGWAGDGTAAGSKPASSLGPTQLAPGRGSLGAGQPGDGGSCECCASTLEPGAGRGAGLGLGEGQPLPC